MSKYDDVRDIQCSKNVRELRTKDQFRDLVYSNKEGIEEVLQGIEEDEWGFIAGKYLLELTGQDVFRKDRNDVRHSFRTQVNQMMKFPAEISTIDFNVCSETKQKVKKTAPKRKAAMKRIDTHEQMINNLQSQFEMNCEEIKQLETDNKEIKVALRALSNLRK